MTTDNKRLYEHALKDLGLREKEGPGSTPRIATAIKAAADWLDRDDSATAWCGCIRGLWGIETGTGVPRAHYRAASWLSWGKVIADARSGIENAKQGDTVILRRTGGHHVALWDHLDGGIEQKHDHGADRVWLLGGNQGDAVSLQRFKVADIVGIRRCL